MEVVYPILMPIIFPLTTVTYFWSRGNKKSALEIMREFETTEKKFERSWVKENNPEWQEQMNHDYKQEDKKGGLKKVGKSILGFAIAIIPWAIPGAQPIAPITTAIGLGLAGYDITDNSLGAICSKDRKKKWTAREELVDENTETEK